MVIEINLNCIGKNRVEILLSVSSLFKEIPTEVINNEEKIKQIKELTKFVDLLYRFRTKIIDRNQFLNELGLPLTSKVIEIPLIKKCYEQQSEHGALTFIEDLNNVFKFDFSNRDFKIIDLIGRFENLPIKDNMKLLFKAFEKLIYTNYTLINYFTLYSANDIKEKVILNIFVSELEDFLSMDYVDCDEIKDIRILYTTIPNFNVAYKIGTGIFMNTEPIDKKILLQERLLNENITTITEYEENFFPDINFNGEMLKNVKTYVISLIAEDKNDPYMLYYDIDGNLIRNLELDGIKDMYINKHIIDITELDKWCKYESVKTTIYNCDYDTNKYGDTTEKPTFSDVMKGGKRYNLNNISFYIFVFLIVLVIIIMIISIIPLLHRCLKHHKFVQRNTFHRDM